MFLDHLHELALRCGAVTITLCNFKFLHRTSTSNSNFKSQLRLSLAQLSPSLFVLSLYPCTLFYSFYLDIFFCPIHLNFKRHRPKSRDVDLISHENLTSPSFSSVFKDYSFTENSKGD